MVQITTFTGFSKTHHSSTVTVHFNAFDELKNYCLLFTLS